MKEVQKYRIYRHFKGDYYLVEDLVRDADTGEECVLYRQLYGDGSLWVRRLSDFVGEVDLEKYPRVGQTQRFALTDVQSVRSEQDAT